MSKEKLSNYSGYVAVTLGVLMILQLPQGYYTYAEYDAISSILIFLPTFAATTILFNIFIMPCSWTLCFMAIVQMLEEKDLPFKKANFAKVIVGLSSFFGVLTIVNMGLFYGFISSGLSSSLASTLPSYLTDENVRSLWDKTFLLMQCCGAYGPSDFLQLGGVSPCTMSGLGCGETIVINFYVLWIWTILSQVGAIAISLHGVWPKRGSDEENADGLWKKFKSIFD